MAVVATIVAVAALVMATTRSPASDSLPTTAVPTYSVAEVSAAHQKLCDAYKLAARAVGVDTNGNSLALARIAFTNAAAMLDSTDNDPAIDNEHRGSAHALATAYRELTASSSSDAFTEREYRAALNDVGVKEAAMKKYAEAGDLPPGKSE